MTVALVPSCPETGLGTGRSPPAGPHEQPRLCPRLTGEAPGSHPGDAIRGVFPAGAAGVAVPIAIFTTGVPLLLTAVWGIVRGQSLLAGIFGTVAGLFMSFGFLVVGLAHNWYAIPAADVPAAEAAYFIAFGSYFLFLLLVPSLRLPGIYTLTITLVVLGLGLAAASELAAAPVLAQAAGAVFLAITFLLFWLFLNVHTTAVGMKPWPPLGKPWGTPSA